jgi:hypothetical protein
MLSDLVGGSSSPGSSTFPAGKDQLGAESSGDRTAQPLVAGQQSDLHSGAGLGQEASLVLTGPVNSGEGVAQGASDEDDDSSSSDEDSGSEYEVPVRTHGDWDAFVDEDTGTEYYYNRKTGETTWDVPDPALVPPHLAALEFLNKLMTNPYDIEQPHPLSSHGAWSLYVDSDSMAMYYVSPLKCPRSCLFPSKYTF